MMNNKNNMLKSSLPYPVSKSRAVETIAKLLPDFDEFRELFFEDGSVFVQRTHSYGMRNTLARNVATERCKPTACKKHQRKHFLTEMNFIAYLNVKYYHIQSNKMKLFDEKGKKYNIALIPHSVRNVSLGRKCNQPPTLHSVGMQPNNKNE
jgi:site-specific DNA-adenine methylase